MALYPQFRKYANGKVCLSDSIEAMAYGRNKYRPPQMTFEQTVTFARDNVRKRQGNLNDRRDVLGEYVINFGKYQGQSFRWLLENTPGYVGSLLGSMLRERATDSDKSGQSQKAVKNSLLDYVLLFPESIEVMSAKLKEKPDTLAMAEWRKALSKMSTPVSTPVKVPSSTVQPVSTARTQPASVTNRPSATYSRILTGNISHHQMEQRVRKLVSPIRYSPNIPSRKRRTISSSSEDSDFELISCLEAVEATVADSKSAEERRDTLVDVTKAKRRILVESTTTSHSDFETVSYVDTSGIQSSTPMSLPAAVNITTTCQTTKQTSTTVAQSTTTPSTLADPPLFAGWKKTLPRVDHNWISSNFFNSSLKGVEFRQDKANQLWHYPPQPSIQVNVRNKMDRYFAHRLFLWMPLNIWAVRLLCPYKDKDDIQCKGLLRRAGIHQKTRMVLDVDSYYIIASEYLQCSTCSRKMISWAHNILSQLDNDKRMYFPCILTGRYACDIKVVEMLRQRTLGNSSTTIMKKLKESHSNRYLKNCHHYMTMCKKFKASVDSGLLTTNIFPDLPPAPLIPNHKWFMQVYQLDVLQRHNYIKSSITSTFGKVIKLDSTKKITKKMAGRSSHTAMWATNVGNEYGQVLMSVLTVGEGQGLEKMIQGLISRYMTAQMPAPKLLYVDRDCCGGSSIGRYFYDWPFLHIRLDIWHFMRRLSTGCTSDAHQLYGTFMGHISKCIFKWDQGDVQLLKEAKKAEMLQHGIPDPSDADVLRYIKPSELSIHCRRMTRGVDETTTLLSQLIESLSGDKGKDVMGVHLFDEDRMRDVWAQQSRHVGCIQDPANISLYTKIRTMKKGGIELPVFRCARGSTSLESFHLHMNRFIPGTLASDINFQVYVLDGIFRWNEDRRKEAVTETSSLTTYEGPLQHSINQLSEEVYGKKLVTDYRPPSAYTGELIGIEYLYSQSSEKTVKYQEETDKLEEGTNTDEEETANDEDGEELEDYDEVRDVTIPPAVEDLPQTIQRPALHPSVDAELQHPSQEDVRDQPQVVHTEKDHTEKPDESDVGPDNIPGYTKVLELATFLVSLMDTTAPLSTFQIDKIIQLWNALSEYDKKRTVFPERYAVSSGTGRFKSPKRKVAPGVVSMQRVILGPNAEPASRPSCNRYVEATITLLLQKIRSDRRPKDKKPTTHWNLINQAYGVIASQVNNSPRVISLTDITLPRLNSKTILEWYNKKEKALDLQICQQGLELPTPKMTTTEQAPPQLLLPNILPFGTSQPFKFDSPPDTSGMTVHKKRYRPIMPAPVSLLSQTQACLSTSPLTVSVTPKVSQQKRPKPVLRKQSVICNQCGGDRTASSHKQYRGYRYCPNQRTSDL